MLTVNDDQYFLFLRQQKTMLKMNNFKVWL